MRLSQQRRTLEPCWSHAGILPMRRKHSGDYKSTRSYLCMESLLLEKMGLGKFLEPWSWSWIGPAQIPSSQPAASGRAPPAASYRSRLPSARPAVEAFSTAEGGSSDCPVPCQADPGLCDVPWLRPGQDSPLRKGEISLFRGLIHAFAQQPSAEHALRSLT